MYKLWLRGAREQSNWQGMRRAAGPPRGSRMRASRLGPEGWHITARGGRLLKEHDELLELELLELPRPAARIRTHGTGRRASTAGWAPHVNGAGGWITWRDELLELQLLQLPASSCVVPHREQGVKQHNRHEQGVQNGLISRATLRAPAGAATIAYAELSRSILSTRPERWLNSVEAHAHT